MQWVFKIFDRVSQPAQKMSAGLQHFEKGLDKAGKSAHDAQGHIRKLGHELIEFFALEKGFDLLKEGFHKAFDLGKDAFNAVALKEGTLVALKYLTGSKEAAEELFEVSEQLAKGTGLETKAVLGWAQALAVAHLPLTQIITLMKAASDLEVLKGKGSGAGGQFAEIIRQIAGADDVVNVKLIDRLKTLDINMASLYENLAKILGLKGTKAAEFIAQIKEGAVAGVPSEAIISAALQAVSDTMHGAPLGSVGKEFRQTAGGKQQALANQIDEMFESIAGGKGMRAFKGVIENLVKVMSPGGPLGQALRAFVDGPVAKFFEMFSGPEGAKRIQDSFKGVLEIVLAVTKAIMALFEVTTKALSGEYGDKLYKALNPPNPTPLPHPGGGLNPANWPTLLEGPGGPSLPANAPSKPTGMLTPRGNTVGDIQFNFNVPPGTSESQANEMARQVQGVLADVFELHSMHRGVA